MNTQYRELVVQGPFECARAFLEGLRIGKGWTEPILFSREAGIRRASLRDRIVEMFGMTLNLSHALVPSQHRDAIVEALASASSRLGLELQSDRAVHSASFEFEYEIYSPHYANKVRELFENPPAGVVLEGFAPQVEENPEARGVEAYAPEHDYVERAEATARGPVDAVVALHSRVREQDLVRCGEIELDLGD